MPATSKEQYRFMQAVSHGWKPKSGGAPTKKQAAEFVSKTKSPSKLPARKGK